MYVPVMHVGIVRVAVRQQVVAVRVCVRLPGRIVDAMGVLVMLVVYMRMGVHKQFMRVLVVMPLGQMQKYTEGHQQARDPGGRAL